MIQGLDDPSDRDFALQLYVEHYQLVRRHIYKIINSEDHLDDLCQDSFVKLIPKLKLLRSLDCCRLTSYIVYTSRNVAYDYIAHRNRQGKHLFLGAEGDLAAALPDEAQDLERQVIRREQEARLQDAVMQLAEPHRTVLLSKYILEMTDREIAAVLNINPNSVRTYLTRARREAKALLTEEVKDHD